MQLNNITVMLLDCLEAGFEPEIDGPWGDDNTDSLYFSFSNFDILLLTEDDVFVQLLLYFNKIYKGSVMAVDWHRSKDFEPWKDLPKQIKNLISDFVVKYHDTELL